MVFTKIVERKSEKKFFFWEWKKKFPPSFFQIIYYFQNASANYDLVSHPKWNPYLLYDRAYTEVSF